MNRIYLFFILILFSLFLYLIKNKIVEFSNFVKSNIEKIETSISNEITTLKNQSEEIKRLKKANLILKSKIANYESFIFNCIDLKKLVKDSNLTLVKTISYAALPDFSQIYINYSSKSSYPQGLVYNNLAAGVVVKKIGKYSLALLNSNKNTSYTVFIGKDHIPGIFYGKENVIKYIPKFKKIKKGDLVITSGLDGIFYKGAKVGVIESIKETNLYQKAKVKLFYNDLEPNYFYVVNKYDRIRKKGGVYGFNKH